MSESIRRVYDSDAQRLVSMMELDTGVQKIWQPEELGAILQHQLSAPVQFDLGSLEKGLARKLKTLSASQGLLLKSFADLLHHPHPPVELLRLTKEFAKVNRSHPDSPLPREIATVLYFAAIVVAMLRCGQRITRLGNDELREGMEWVIAQPWSDESTRSLFNEGIELLDAQKG